MTPFKNVAALAASSFILLGIGTPAQGASEPWRDPQDTSAAMFDTDKYAWRVFVAMNWPADTAKRAPDPNKTFGADGPATWETWRSVNNNAPDTMFPPNGADPGEWLSPGTPVASHDSRSFEAVPRQQRMFAAQQALISGRGLSTPPSPAFEAEAAEFSGNEVRMNRAAYEFVRVNKLYNVEGQMAAAGTGIPSLAFPPSAKIVKAQWRAISEADKPRYHWAEVTTPSGQKRVWGLTALHITTKDTPNWFWATFEHIDNKTPRPASEGIPPNEGWILPSVDRAACPAPPHNCDGAPKGFGLEGTKWANYRLRGVQLDFVTSMGVPTILANSQIERGFQRRSSCITCHADAVINSSGQGLPFSTVVGVPDPNKFRDPLTGQRAFMQLDFLWSLQRAQPTGQ